MPTAFDQVCARCRLAGEKLFLKGEKCFTPKCPMVRRPYPPGAHGQKRRRTGTEYGRQLREKQALRAIYGLGDRQLRNVVAHARRQPGVTAEILMNQLEARLDNVVFRLGFGVSRPHARQLVHHGLITVNGRRVDVPSFAVAPGDVVGVKVSKRAGTVFLGLEDRIRVAPLPSWLERVDPWTGRLLTAPALEAHQVPVDARSVVEFYAR